MQPERTDLKYAWDMHDAARDVVEWTRGRTLIDYESDKMLRLAVERAIEIIGEAARQTSQPFRDANADIPWSAIIATRHIFAHEYGDLKHDKVWRIATVHVPALVEQLKPLLDANPPEDDPQ